MQPHGEKTVFPLGIWPIHYPLMHMLMVFALSDVDASWVNNMDIIPSQSQSVTQQINEIKIYPEFSINL